MAAANNGNLEKKLEKFKDEDRRLQLEKSQRKLRSHLFISKLLDFDILGALASLSRTDCDLSGGSKLSLKEYNFQKDLGSFVNHLAKDYPDHNFNLMNVSENTAVLKNKDIEVLYTGNFSLFNSLLSDAQNGNLEEECREQMSSILDDHEPYLRKIGLTLSDLFLNEYDEWLDEIGLTPEDKLYCGIPAIDYEGNRSKKANAKAKLITFNLFYNGQLQKDCIDSWKDIKHLLIPESGQGKNLKEILKKQNKFNKILESAGILPKHNLKNIFEIYIDDVKPHDLEKFYNDVFKSQNASGRVKSDSTKIISFDGKTDYNVGIITDYVREIIHNDPDNKYAIEAREALEGFNNIAQSDKYNDKKEAILDVWASSLRFLYHIKQKQREFTEFYVTHAKMGARGEADLAPLEEKRDMHESEKGLLDKLEDRAKKSVGSEEKRYKLCLNHAKVIDSCNEKMFPHAELHMLINYSDILQLLSKKTILTADNALQFFSGETIVQEFANIYDKAINAFSYKHGDSPNRMALVYSGNNNEQAKLVLSRKYESKKRASTKYFSVPVDVTTAKTISMLMQHIDGYQKMLQAPGIEGLTK